MCVKRTISDIRIEKREEKKMYVQIKYIFTYTLKWPRDENQFTKVGELINKYSMKWIFLLKKVGGWKNWDKLKNRT